MSEAKNKTIIGPCIVGAVLLIIIISFLLWSFPETVEAATSIAPVTGLRILTWAAVAMVLVLLIGWTVESLFRRSGKTGVKAGMEKNKQRVAGANDFVDAPDIHKYTAFSSVTVAEHLRFRFGRRWQRKVNIVLVEGGKADVDAAIPQLTSDIWQEGEGFLLVYGGDAQTEPDDALLTELKQLRPRRPVDGILLILNGDALPGQNACDVIARNRHKADSPLGWQAPVWLMLNQQTHWPQNVDAENPVAALFGPDSDANSATSLIDELIPRLRSRGIALSLEDTRNDWHLDLAARLQHQQGKDLSCAIHALKKGPADYRLSGVIFTSKRVVKGHHQHILSAAAIWHTLGESCASVRPRKLSTDWMRFARFALFTVLGLWFAGTLMSLAVNRTQIYQAQETARVAADNRASLTERLQHQMALQQAIARLQHRQKTGAPWYTRFGLNQDAETLTSLWPLYARVNNALMRDVAAQTLKAQLDDFVRLQPASSERLNGTQHTYDLLKTYLMLARPDKADAEWLAKNTLLFWPQREGVQKATWQTLAPKLLGFWAQNFPQHPEWKIKPDTQLTSTVRQILLKQIGQRNAESGLYQTMLQRVARNWPDLSLADMTGDTDASTLFYTDEVVPGMFTRQAWDEQVEQAIDDVVSARRDEIDWVLTDKMHLPGSESSPEALKARLTERYFTDFGNVWLNMVNSIQWQDATSLSEAIGQLNQLADVRQSPLVALMNTLAWQGKTAQKSEALADTLVDSAKQLISREKKPKQLISQAQGPKGPLDSVFGPLASLMEGKDGTGRNGNLSFQSWLARVTQVRLKLQQVTSAPDPQAMAQMLAQTVFQGKSIDLTDTRDYGSLVAASLGQEWSGFGQALFVQPLDLAWRQVLAPAADSLNARWQSTIVQQWNSAFAGRYPFKATGSDASIPLLANFLRADSGRIAAFLKSNLGGILHQEGNRWVVDPSASQGMQVDTRFIAAVNQLASIADIAFAQGDAGLRFELMARPSKDVARVQMTIDEQKIDYFNQMEGWQSFKWPGETYYPGANLKWQTVTSSGMQLYQNNQGNWGWIRLLEKAQNTPLDSSRSQLTWNTTDGKALKFILRSELGEGPLALLKLRGFALPQNIFDVDANAIEQAAQPADEALLNQ
jgi:type VI secretion system protein ImpL